MNFMGLAASLLILIGASQPSCTITELKSPVSEDYLWEILQEEAPNDYAACGILAYFWRESGYRSDAMTHWIYYKEDPCAEFTAKLDAANRDEFVELIQSVGGYGLGQWYAKSHLESLYDFCKGYDTSFADAAMQCRFTIHMCVNDPYVWRTLKDASNALEAGKIIGCLHDGSPWGAEIIAAKAALIYKERVINNEHDDTDGHISVCDNESSGTDADDAEASDSLPEAGGDAARRADSRSQSGNVPG